MVPTTVYHVENVWIIYTEYVICFHHDSYWYKNSESVPQAFQNVPQIKVQESWRADQVDGVSETIWCLWDGKRKVVGSIASSWTQQTCIMTWLWHVSGACISTHWGEYMFWLRSLLGQSGNYWRPKTPVIGSSGSGSTLHWPPGPHLIIKTVFPRYGDSHIKDKTVVRPSYL